MRTGRALVGGAEGACGDKARPLAWPGRMERRGRAGRQRITSLTPRPTKGWSDMWCGGPTLPTSSTTTAIPRLLASHWP